MALFTLALKSNTNLTMKIMTSSSASVACAVGPSVTTSSTDFSVYSLVFWNLFEFSAAEISLKSISRTF